MSPFLFLSVIDRIMRTKTSDRNIGIQWSLLTQLNDLNFADDLALISHNLIQMQDKTRLVKTSAGTGLKINWKKPRIDKEDHQSQLAVSPSAKMIPSSI